MSVATGFVCCTWAKKTKFPFGSKVIELVAFAWGNGEPASGVNTPVPLSIEYAYKLEIISTDET